MKGVLCISEMALPPRTGIPSSKSLFSGTASVFVDKMVDISASSPVFLESVGEHFPDSYTLSDLVPSRLQHDRSEDVAKCFVESSINSPNASVKAMCKIPKQHPHPFHGNYSILPDVIVTKCGLGMLVVEVVSSNDYKKTFAKTVIDCIEILRTWRCHNGSVDECYGFMLPNLSETSCALEVRVKFQPFKFLYWMDYVGKNEVQDRIKRIVSQWQFECNEPHPCYFFIRLRQEECNLVENGAVQVYSQSSIVLKSPPSFFWKYNRHTSIVFERHFVNVGLAEQRLCQYALFPFSLKRVSLTEFLQFHALQDPLSRTEAKPCLLPLLDGLHCALTELYQKNIAHLDIRLPNICFGSGCTVTLVDLDRCDYADNGCSKGVSFHHVSDMYKKLRRDIRWTNRHADMRSVGMMICYILDPTIKGEDYHTMISDDKVSLQFRQDDFIKKLLEYGEWDNAMFTAFKDRNSTLNEPIPRA